MARRLDHERINRIARTKIRVNLSDELRPAKKSTQLSRQRKPKPSDQKRAEIAWRHFKIHGDLSLAQRIADSLLGDLRVSFLRWMIDTSPAKMKFGVRPLSRLVKDKDRALKPSAFDEVAALSQPFWQYQPKISTKRGKPDPLG